MANEIALTIPAFPPVRNTIQTISLSRINVILGLNGSGKTKLLKEMQEQAKLNKISVLHIEGYRYERAPYITTISASYVEQFRDKIIEKAEQEYHNPELGGGRIGRAFRVMAARDHVATETYRNSVVRWFEAGQMESEKPLKPVLEIQTLLDSFCKLLPHIEFVQVDTIIQTRYRKRGLYGLHSLSDGEREVICHFIDAWVGTPKDGIVLVDEPELHLHPSLACTFWDLIEKQFPNTIFVYATHFIGFALRSTISKLFHIGNDGQIVNLPGIEALSYQEKADFLGAIPGILHSSRVLFCEGTRFTDQEDTGTNSIDYDLYSWLLKEDSVTIQPIGPLSSVIEAIKKTEAIHQLSRDIVVAGVVDRDDYPDERIGNHEIFVEVLPYHEAECYLCNIDLLLKIAEHKKIKITRTDLLELLVTYAKEQKEQVASLRFAQRKLKPGQQYRMIDEEMQKLTDAIDRKDIEEILRYFHGKELANKIAPSVGCNDSRDLLSNVVSTIHPDSVEALALLRRKLLKRLSKPSPDRG